MEVRTWEGCSGACGIPFALAAQDLPLPALRHSLCPQHRAVEVLPCPFRQAGLAELVLLATEQAEQNKTGRS